MHLTHTRSLRVMQFPHRGHICARYDADIFLISCLFRLCRPTLSVHPGYIMTGRLSWVRNIGKLIERGRASDLELSKRVQQNHKVSLVVKLFRHRIYAVLADMLVIHGAKRFDSTSKDRLGTI